MPERNPQEQLRSDAKGVLRIGKTRTLFERSDFVRVSIRCERALLIACDEDLAKRTAPAPRAGCGRVADSIAGRRVWQGEAHCPGGASRLWQGEARRM